MADHSELAAFVRWTDADVQKRLRALWLNWYKVTRIAEIFGCQPSAVTAAAYRLNLPHRPHSEFHKWKSLPELECWPPPLCPSTFVVPKYLRLRPYRTRSTPAVIVLPPPVCVEVVSTREFLDMLPPLEIVREQAVVSPPPPWLVPASKPAPVAKPKAVPKPPPAKAKPASPKPMPLPLRITAPRLKRGDRVFSEAEDQAQIEEFLRTKGATQIPIGACLHDVAAGPRSWEDRKAEQHRISSSRRRWNEFRDRQAAIRGTV